MDDRTCGITSQFAVKFLFPTVKMFIEERMELCGVVVMNRVAKFVNYNIVDKMLGKSHQIE